MATSTDKRSPFTSGSITRELLAKNSRKSTTTKSPVADRLRGTVTRTAPRIQTEPPEARVELNVTNVRALQERRGRRRATVPPMYTSAMIRILSRREAPMDAHVMDVSETGLAVEADFLLPVGQAVTVEFRIAGLGRLRHEEWSELNAAAMVVRHDNLDDFPGGPYKIGLRFIRISTMTQAQIARFIATQPD